MIGASMATFGQRAPIEVLPARPDGKYPLIAGAHRLHGAKMEGMETILAVIRDVSADTAELIEIDENLTRHELNALDRAVFLERRKDIYERLYPEAKAGGNRKKDQNDKLVVLIRSFSAETSEKLGLSVRSIERMVERARGIAPAVRDQIAGTWLATRGSHLDALAKLPAGEQHAVVDQLLHHDVTSVSEALRIVRQVPVKATDVVEADFKRLVRVWERSDMTAQKRFLEHVRAQGRQREAGRS